MPAEGPVVPIVPVVYSEPTQQSRDFKSFARGPRRDAGPKDLAGPDVEGAEVDGYFGVGADGGVAVAAVGGEPVEPQLGGDDAVRRRPGRPLRREGGVLFAELGGMGRGYAGGGAS